MYINNSVRNIGNKVKDVAQKVKNLKSVTISHRKRVDNFNYARPQDWDPVDFYFQVIILGRQEGINFHDELRDFIVTSVKVYCRKVLFKGFAMIVSIKRRRPENIKK